MEENFLKQIQNRCQDPPKISEGGLGNLPVPDWISNIPLLRTNLHGAIALVVTRTRAVIHKLDTKLGH